MATSHPIRTDLTAEYLRSILDYNPTTGAFTWRSRPREHFRRTQAWSAWNTKYAGKVAGGLSDGYWLIGINNRVYRSHRLAWLYVHGEWPAAEIDHINLDKCDNRIVNLRPADRSQNAANMRRTSQNTSGFKGVSWNKRRGKWKAYIRKGGVLHHLGYFDTAEEAHATYVKEATRLQGEFVRTD